MNMLNGRKIERQELFDESHSSELAADSQDIEMFDELMKSRLDIAQPTVVEETSSTEPAPVFRMFASAKAVKVETAPIEPVFIAPTRPLVPLEESDSEDHWNMLRSAAIDAQTIKDMAKVPLPALQFPKRVIHIKLEPKENVAAESKLKRRKHRPVKRTKQPYVRVLSPYMGGTVRGEMLADVLRKEEIQRVREAKLAAKRGGFRGRGRGRIFK
ncbi:hypothetical protein EV183_003533 [Coemansia sp. RSA 2336]|nr:hypothetical protein EV183_003533 [Coemansia sp. RSA 2336]